MSNCSHVSLNKSALILENATFFKPVTPKALINRKYTRMLQTPQKPNFSFIEKKETLRPWLFTQATSSKRANSAARPSFKPNSSARGNQLNESPDKNTLRKNIELIFSSNKRSSSQKQGFKQEVNGKPKGFSRPCTATNQESSPRNPRYKPQVIRLGPRSSMKIYSTSPVKVVEPKRQGLVSRNIENRKAYIPMPRSNKKPISSIVNSNEEPKEQPLVVKPASTYGEKVWTLNNFSIIDKINNF